MKNLIIKNKNKIFSLLIIVILVFTVTSCESPRTHEETTTAQTSLEATQNAEANEDVGKDSKESISEEASNATTEAIADVAEKNGEIYILYTSDVHCGIDRGYGYAGLYQVKETLEKNGYTTILVDNGDAFQGETVGTLSKGEDIIRLMNDVGYDVAVPGNHDFDYGMDRFFELTETADFPYICCNFNYMNRPVFEPYVIIEAEGKKIAFVGVTTPTTLTTSTPEYFQNDKGEFVYDFLNDKTGDGVYSAVQEAIDDARNEGADLVYVLGHMGMKANASPWTYADVIEHTEGIDVFLDGHSHDTEQVVMKDKAGKEVPRSACGTKLANIGYSHISNEGEILGTGIWTWTNDMSVPEMLGIENKVTEAVSNVKENLKKITDQVIARSEVELTIFDPEEKDSKGAPVRMVRRAETNLGDFCADVIRSSTDADIALINGGGVRDDMHKGDITYGDILTVWPFNNNICVIEATGQQILDALEWGVKDMPDEHGGFLQVSGISFEVNVNVPSGCRKDEDGVMIGIEGERRVKNVLVDGSPIAPDKKYKVAGLNYTLLEHGDGHTAFEGCDVLEENVGVDHQMMIDYITTSLGGVIGEEYSDPYGQGRIVITGDQ